MKIHLTNGEKIEMTDKFAKSITGEFNSLAGRSTADGFIEVQKDGVLNFVLNKKYVLYIY